MQSPRILHIKRFLTYLFLLAVLVSLAPALSANLASAQGPGEAILFKDNWENGSANAWRFTDANGQPSTTAWQAEKEPDGNWVLSGTGHNWANLVQQYAWRDFRVSVRVKILSGAVHLNYRLSSASRYYIWLGPGGIALSKQYFPDKFFNDLAGDQVPNAIGAWHNVTIVGKGANLKVSVDGAPRIDYTDAAPILAGSIAFETLDDSHIHLDDVTVIGPAPTPTPDRRFSWVRTGGPLGGIGYDVRVDPTHSETLYVTDAWSGVSKSENAGALWTPMNQGIVSRTGPSGDAIPVFCLTIDPRNPQVLWAGTQNMRGVYKSNDSGKTWLKTDNGIPDLEGITFRAFTIDPNDSNVVYASTEIPTRRKGPDGQNEVGGKIYKTTDGGKTWREILDTGALVRWLMIDPTDTRILYAATGIFDRDDVRSEGVLKSTDGGKTWRNLNDGLTNLTIGGLVMDPRNSEVLYAATGRHNGFGGGPEAAYGGVFKTTDGGETWVEILHRPSDYFPVTAMTLAPSNPDIVYVAPTGSTFFRSKDGGQTWQSFGMDPDGASVGIPIAVTADPRDPNIVYINSYIGGVFKSTDGGETWHIASQGYTGAQLTGVGVDPNNPALVYSIGRQGVAKSETAGDSWVYVNRGDATQFMEGASLSVNPRNPRDVLIAHRFDGRILRTTDGGATWRRVLDALPNEHYPDNLHGAVQFVRFRGNPDIVYAAGRMATETMAVNLHAKSLGVLKSSDGGEHWQSMNTGLIPDLNINAIAIHPTDANVVYAGAFNGGVYQTTDGGAHWRAIGSNFAIQVTALAIDPTNPNLIYAGTEERGLYISTDAGRTWKASSAGMEPNAAIRSIVIDPAHPQIVWAADVRSGVYRSADGGKTWARTNLGLRTRAVNALTISADGQVLYAATEGEGVFRLGTVQIPTPAPTVVPSATVPASPPTSAPVPTLAANLQPTSAVNAAPTPASTPTSNPARGICGGAITLPLALLGLVWLRWRRRWL